MMNLEQVFQSTEQLAQRCSQINLLPYFEEMQNIHAVAPGEQSGNVHLLPKEIAPDFGQAFAVLFLSNLFTMQEWKHFGVNLDLRQDPDWEQSLRDIWIPQWFTLRDGIPQQHEENFESFQQNFFEVAQILSRQIDLSDIKQILRINDIDAWNTFEYLIETETAFIWFQYWTTA